MISDIEPKIYQQQMIKIYPRHRI